MSPLPGRNEVLERLDEMLSTWQDIESTDVAKPPYPASSPDDESAHLSEPKPPAIYAIGIVDHQQVISLDPEGVAKAMEEIAWRLDKLVRSGDVLGLGAPDTFLLAAASMAPSSAGVVMERITGAVAMPLEIDGGPVSLRVGIGLAFAFDGASSESMLAAAERDMLRSMER